MARKSCTKSLRGTRLSHPVCSPLFHQPSRRDSNRRLPREDPDRAGNRGSFLIVFRDRIIFYFFCVCLFKLGSFIRQIRMRSLARY